MAMTMTEDQATHIRAAAAEALGRGDGRAALTILEPLAQGDMQPWLLIAQAAMLTGDHDRAEGALDEILAREPRHLAAMILKGDCRVAAKDSRAATSYYAAALQLAPPPAQTTPALRAALERAAAAQASLATQFEDDLRSALNQAGHKGGSPRIAEALDILTGRKEIYIQQPTSFFFPGLPQIQFYEREAFDWAFAIEAQTAAIRDELLAVMAAEDDGFRPYVESEPGRPAKQNRMVGDTRWSAYYLWQNGEPVADHAARCPATMAAFEHAPIPHINKRSPMALFSRLEPGMHILPHTGFLNTRLICHLPLIVPDGCRFRVGNEERQWEEGKLLIFDDSIEHEAWNEGSETRVVLLFEIWRPEISEEDRAALSILFEYIAAYSH